MTTSAISFAHLRGLLLELDFKETRTNAQWRFEHPSGAVFLFRPYAPMDKVSIPDLVSTRQHLDWRGLLSESAFDDSLAKTPA